MNWYYADAGNQAGPVTDAELEQLVQAGKITANTLVWHEGMTSWRPFREVAPAGLTGLSQPPLPPAPPAGSTDDLAAIQDRDYTLDISSCVSRSWQLVKGNFWPLLGATLLILILATAWNEVISLFTGRSVARLIEGIQHRRFEPVPAFVVFLSSLAGSLLYGILYGGLYLFFLKLIRGEAVNPGILFAGFGPSALPLLVASLLISLLTLLGIACCLLPGIYLSVSWLFAFPLIIDRRMDFWPAMELSRKLVTRHWWMVFALAVVAGLLAFAGVILCCIGILVTVPISMGALMYAYEDIFGARTP
ncbi:MAG: GYF domain-containing protein [Limisphaerales bacterium]